MSVNLELPTAEGLKKLAPHKSRRTILAPMRQIQTMRQENQYDLTVYRRTSRFVPGRTEYADDHWCDSGE